MGRPMQPSQHKYTRNGPQRSGITLFTLLTPIPKAMVAEITEMRFAVHWRSVRSLTPASRPGRWCLCTHKVGRSAKVKTYPYQSNAHRHILPTRVVGRGRDVVAVERLGHRLALCTTRFV